VASAAAAASLPFLGILISSAMSGRLTLPARLRLRRKGDFDAAYARGRRMSDGFFSVTARGNDAGAPRLGLAVAVKIAGSAVARNRLRRIIRESFRLHQRVLPAVDLVVSARPAARAADAAALRASLAALWKKVGEQCATSPPC
jgi:ribonuclease P protein component